MGGLKDQRSPHTVVRPPDRNDGSGNGGVLGLHHVQLGTEVGGAASDEWPQTDVFTGVVMVKQIKYQTHMLERDAARCAGEGCLEAVSEPIARSRSRRSAVWKSRFMNSMPVRTGPPPNQSTAHAIERAQPSNRRNRRVWRNGAESRCSAIMGSDDGTTTVCVEVADLMLYGRDLERSAITALLDGARAARGGVLVLRGGPGAR